MGECTMGTGKNSLIPKKTNPPTCTQVTVEMKERRDYNESHTGLQEGFRAGFRSGGVGGGAPCSKEPEIERRSPVVVKCRQPSTTFNSAVGNR